MDISLPSLWLLKKIELPLHHGRLKKVISSRFKPMDEQICIVAQIDEMHSKEINEADNAKHVTVSLLERTTGKKDAGSTVVQKLCSMISDSDEPVPYLHFGEWYIFGHSRNRVAGMKLDGESEHTLKL